MSVHKPYTIARRDQILALSSPARQEIVDALHATGPASIAAVAQILGRAADSLYYHVGILRKVGLLVEVETRRRGRRDEVIYDLPGRPLHIAYNLSDPRSTAGVVATIASMLRITERDFRAAAEEGTAAVAGPCRSLWGSRLKGWVSQAQLRALNRYFKKINEIMSSPRPRRGSRLHAVTFVIAPVEPNARAASKPSRKRGGQRDAEM